MDENEKAILMLSNHITKLKIQYEGKYKSYFLDRRKFP